VAADIKNKLETSTDALVENVQTKVTESAAVSTKAQQSSRQSTKQSVKVAKTNKKSTSIKAEKKDIVLTAGYTDVKATEVKPVEAIRSESKIEALKENRPRLSISGGELSAMPSNNPQLRMDMQLQFTPENAPVSLQSALAGDIEIEDEVVVLNKRMAHLKSQVDKLGQTNQALKTENQAQLQKLQATSSAKNSLDSLGYILGGALLFSSFNIANKWRIRRQQKLFEETQFALATEHLSPLEGLSASDRFFDFDKDQAFTKETEDTTQHFDISESENDQFFAPAIEDKPAPFSVEEFNDEQNILDHADVFLSHGRTSLAIQLLQNHLIDHPKKSVTEWPKITCKPCTSKLHWSVKNISIFVLQRLVTTRPVPNKA
jgi:hypothetical protein